LETSLALIADAMAPAGDPWWIIGSTAVALHGADPVSIDDIDVVLSVADAGRVLPTIGVALTPGSSDGQFRSAIYNRWAVPAHPAEFMAGFELYEEGAWSPVTFTTREQVRPGIFVPSNDELHALLLRFGRPKDLRRAASLRSA
jgi:hypothetical protein